MREARIEVFGRVQGVGFRRNVKKIADNLGLRGIVMNLGNGGALINVQGDRKIIEEFAQKIRGNPGFARVEDADIIWSDVVNKYDGFRILSESNIIFDKLKSILNLFKRAFIKRAKIARIPKHIVIIPDGNRRWARHRNLEPHFGHYKSGSYISMESLLKEARKLGVKCFSIWGFSTENWKRSKEEREAIFDLIYGAIERFRKDARNDKIRFKHIGRKDRLPRKLINALEKIEKETKDNNDFVVQLCLDYGGKDEIVRAVNKILKSGKKEIDENEFSAYLDSVGADDPDLIIRTGGEKRLSGFMPFQSVYSELFFSDLYFPEFGALELRKIFQEYGNRFRRYGE